MLSLRAGNWFLSPLYVLGSEDANSQDLYLCFERKLYEELEVKVLGKGQKILFSKQLCPASKELRIPMDSWPKGEYRLSLEDNKKSYTYKILAA